MIDFFCSFEVQTSKRFQAVKGLRRQFLITQETNIIVLLKRGMKVGSCNDNLRDVTEHVKCKVRS